MYYTFIRDDADEASTPVGVTLQIFRSLHCYCLQLVGYNYVIAPNRKMCEMNFTDH